LLGGVNSVSKIDMHRRDQRHEFASDNTAAICPEVLAALEEANQGAADSYGAGATLPTVSQRRLSQSRAHPD